MAAVAVVAFHFLEMAFPNYSSFFLGHGFLAVDFFFCLSGFVIGYAYDSRIAVLGTWQFLQSRLIRLHPMVVFGSVLGLIALLVDPFAPHPLAYSARRLAVLFLASVLLIPDSAMPDRGFNNFGLNAPAWSLFWEYVASLAYAVVLWRLPRRALLALAALAAIALVYIGHHAGALYGGWDGHTFWHGGARVAYSFLAGLLVYRCGWILRSTIPFLALALLLTLALVMPYAHHGWLRQALVIFFYFPFLVALGAGTSLTPRIHRLCTFAGDLSYPLYMTHYAVIWIFGNYYSAKKPDSAHLALIVVLGVLTMIGFATLVMTFYDTPLRAWLTRRRRAAISTPPTRA